MEYNQISDLREKLCSYRNDIEMNIWCGTQQLFDASPLHGIIENFNLNEVPECLAAFNVNQSTIIQSIENLDSMLIDAIKFIRKNFSRIEDIDNKANGVLNFCNTLHKVISAELSKMNERRATDLTQYEERLVEKISNADENTLENYIDEIASSEFSPKAIRRIATAIEKKTDFPNRAFILDKLQATLQATQKEAEQRKQQQNNDVNSRQTDVSSRQMGVNSRQTDVSSRQTEPRHEQPLKETTEETNIAESELDSEDTQQKKEPSTPQFFIPTKKIDLDAAYSYLMKGSFKKNPCEKIITKDEFIDAVRTARFDYLWKKMIHAHLEVVLKTFIEEECFNKYWYDDGINHLSSFLNKDKRTTKMIFQKRRMRDRTEDFKLDLKIALGLSKKKKKLDIIN